MLTVKTIIICTLWILSLICVALKSYYGKRGMWGYVIYSSFLVVILTFSILWIGEL